MELIRSWRQRSYHDQFLDALGLFHQGWLVSWCAAGLGYFVLPIVLPESVHSFLSFQLGLSSLPNWLLFLLPLTLVDYLYYWNHRLLHGNSFWFLHRVHHSAESLDIWMSSRNSVWTPFVLVYLWFHALLIYAVPDPSFYVGGMLVHGSLDLWRHSDLKTPLRLQFLGAFLILPEDHSWHHSRDKFGVNFGANLSVWDRLHGTLYRPGFKPANLGEENRSGFVQEYFTPWRLPR